MRIVSGAARGRKLFSPPSSTRPTTDRVREALFNSLDTMLEWETTTVLDLYAGSGAVGFEAASRGARAVTLVEKNPAVARCAERNRGVVDAHTVTIVKRSVQAFLAEPPTYQPSTTDRSINSAVPYDLVFADPPYAVVDAEWPGILEALIDGGWVADGTIVVLERSSRDDPTVWPEHYREYRSKKYGETRIDIAIVEATGTLAA